ncbi:MAG: hypothetical protein ACFFER_09115 [Candidatus Thorarchaeota archaeon]
MLEAKVNRKAARLFAEYLEMSESSVILRDKRRFAMYLSMAASMSLWIIPVDWTVVDWTQILARPIIEGGAISFFIAAILYE